MTPSDGLFAGLPAGTRRRLAAYVNLLLKWQNTINLVAPSTLPDVWTRHIADSLQIAAALPKARLWIDLGSGGGLPGLVTAICLAETPGAQVHLVESDKRKVAFLQTVSRETSLPVTVHARRIEAFVHSWTTPVDAVSARALAPLSRLLAFSEPLLRGGATAVFPKGQNADAELTALEAPHRFEITSQPSRTDPAARLLFVRMRA